MIKIPIDVLKKLTVENELISEENFDLALKESQRTSTNILDILVSKNYITKDYLNKVISQYLNIPYIDLKGINLSTEILHLLPEDIARTYGAVTIGTNNNKIQVALADPTNLETIKFLEKYLQKQLEIYLTDEDDLQIAFSKYRQELMTNFRKIIENQIIALGRLGKEIDVAKVASAVPIISIVDNLISYAAALNASDIHLEILADSMLIRFRIDGILREIAYLPSEIHPAIIARIKILANLQIDEHSKPQDGRIKYKRGNEVFDIRVAVMPTFYGEKITMRLLLSGLKPLSFQELGMTSEQIAMVEKNIKKTFGMVLSTGPTSSGKTTTQYSILSYLNKPEVNIVTIEDPIEYELRYINQTQVNPKAGIDFASGLRAFLRHDPNIIMVGEIRDFDTADVSTNAALTGHLVLSTLHTNDAPTAIPRLVDMGVPPFLVSATLNIVMAQRLVRRICPDCIESYEIDDLTKEAIISQVKQLGEERLVSFSMPEMLYRGKGCRNCNYTGYRGRLAIFEMLDVDSDIRNYIVRKDFTLDGLKKIMAQKEMKTMFEDGLDKAKLGQTTVQEILRVIRE
ncbi:MAG TPA: GspE/PulE family protein [Candidatus Paceibacterota bacterium]|jgi:type IV pilus assembly protein PilB|nr:GspE/PulE family protein [Candidatus Paceibacterota bacterium]